MTVLQQQLQDLLASMYGEGLLDPQFEQLQALQDENNPGFVAEVITLFCQDTQRILTELTKYLDMPVVDYQKVDAYVHQLKGSSSSVGAQCVKLACVNFRQACEDNDKDGCLRALNMIKHEYYRVTSKFEIMLQLENRILSYSAKQQ
ncbi:Signal transduction histidine kinase [Macleaya cordata]|uniref:Histidine-containing phosphotransfer protein n=1 Tax=Macleaya cordata TaxID=56857 RepID=A0A200PZF9_MACCD|nr:Signal transduction histidine kinase [Macleaya cordata]